MIRLSRAILRSLGFVLLLVRLAQPGTLAAQPPMYPAMPPGAGCGNGCCATCGQPPDICTCTTFKPICDTCYHRQPYVAYRNVCRTCYKQEPYCVTVPVTKVDCVTVDEGCYKMVWCPKVVTRPVPRVEYHQQRCCRTVPYTVNQQVPYVATQIVPECRVRYCPETHTFLKPPCPQCPCPSPGVGCRGPIPVTSQDATGSAAQAFASLNQPQPQQGAPHADGEQIDAVSQSNDSPATGSPRTTVASANDAMANPYLRARSAANVWQTNRGVAAQ